MRVNPILPTANPRNSRNPEKKRAIRELLLRCFQENWDIETARRELAGLYQCPCVHTVYQATQNNAPDLKELCKEWVKKQPKNFKKGHYVAPDKVPTVGEDLLGLKLIEQGMRYDEYV